MPRQSGTAVENSFRGGLITQATGLNFPENACVDTDNCIFDFDGSVVRRPGFDFEDEYSTKTIDRNNSVVNAFVWKNVSGNGDVSLVVLQVGATLYFYEIDSEDSVSNGALATTVALTSVSGAPTAETVECQFATGNGKLFVTHQYCEPFYVEYDDGTLTATPTDITIKIRDFEGDTLDPYGVDERPTATLAGLDVSHKYNLYNQGWGNATAGSSSGLSSTNLTAWDTAFTTMPSNADVMWSFKNASDAFDTATVPNVPGGNSPAPKGHFILTLADQDRDTASGLTGTTASDTSFYRPTTCAFFAGRLFFGGIPYDKYNSKIYFSQIVERDEQYGYCYQKNDPTSEDSFDLLPDDGGVISIPEAGTIIKLFTVVGGLVVCAQQGVWFITGSTGLGFTANDFTVQKLSSVTSLSAKSFVDVAGNPSWWTTEGIYILTSEEGNPAVQSLSFEKIKEYFDSIPTASKANARGTFNYISGVIQWVFRSESAESPNEDYEYDTVLNFNVATGAFYPWTIPNGTVSINGVVLLDGSTGTLTSVEVIDDSANEVIDDSGNEVIAFTATNSAIVPTFSYIVSYNDGAYQFTFASARNTDYLDWFQYDDVGENFISYFISGYKLRGDGIRKWNNNYLRLHSRNSEDTSYTIRGVWDYATAATTERWSDTQTVTHNIDNYGYVSKRIKIRGSGIALQFLVSSVTGMPFDIIGWSSFDSANALP
jgi:hypothetical protein